MLALWFLISILAFMHLELVNAASKTLFTVDDTHDTERPAVKVRRHKISTGRPQKDERDPTPRQLIVRGNAASPSQYQFFALTMDDEYSHTPDNRCAASLIHSDVLLTAAHCQGYFNFGVWMYNPATREFDRPTKIVEQHRHPNFNLDNTNFNWDILVLRLEAPIYDIAPVPLNRDPRIPVSDEILVAAGFGATKHNSPLSDILMDAELRYISEKTCKDRFQALGVTGAQVGEDILCVDPADAGQSICSGDSGGPLLSADGVLVGVTSFTYECRWDEIPDGFARVSTFSDWIQEKICELSVDKPSSCPLRPTEISNDLVDVRVEFRYDFSPEDTTFAIRNLETERIEYAGPTYVVSDRETVAKWTSVLKLPPGAYNIEVYDKEKNGLGETNYDRQSKGAFAVLAADQDGTEGFSVVAIGDDDFLEESIIRFELSSRPTASPQPTLQPSPGPTTWPTTEPSDTPSSLPSFSPSDGPSMALSLPPTIAPTGTPQPTTFTPKPSSEPSMSPTMRPTVTPSVSVSVSPTGTTSASVVSKQYLWGTLLSTVTALLLIAQQCIGIIL